MELKVPRTNRRSLKPDFLGDLFTDGTQLMDVRDGIVSD